jgi:hypothetical protein
MRMNRKVKIGGDAKALDHLPKASRRERRLSFGREDIN